jgi:hypothetical protein
VSLGIYESAHIDLAATDFEKWTISPFWVQVLVDNALNFAL